MYNILNTRECMWWEYNTADDLKLERFVIYAQVSKVNKFITILYNLYYDSL